MIPIFRAKKIDSEEWVEGSLYSPEDEFHFILQKRSGYVNNDNNLEILDTEYSEIDSSTLAIHFPNMLDKNGKKIFAALNENGVSGDLLLHNHPSLTKGNALKFCVDGCYVSVKSPLNKITIKSMNSSYKTIGIHKETK